MTLQDDRHMYCYVMAKVEPDQGSWGFLQYFLQAAMRADQNNYPLIRPILIALMQKYPPDLARWQVEQAAWEEYSK